MTRNTLRSSASAALLLITAAASAQAWKFGVISDTQWSPASQGNSNSVAINIIDAVNQRFIGAGVDLVLQVGDLCDNGSTAGLQTRADHNAVLTGAGIKFYPVRGNHEGSSSAANYMATAFPNLPSTVPGDGGSTPLPGVTNGLTYSFVHKNTKFMLLDQFTMGNGTSYNVGQYQPWIDSELGAADHSHAFVLGHKNLLGQNHKDNLFGSSNDANPDMQNGFIGSLSSNNVRYYLSGHDHMHHRSEVTSPDGAASVQQIITASDSHKFYTPGSPYSSREQPFRQELGQVGYYLFNVDGPRVTAEYWATAPGNITPPGEPLPANIPWSLKEVFGYSLNGKQFIIGKDQPYAGVNDTMTPGGGYLGTSMAILGGTNATVDTISGNRTVSDDLNTGWSPRASAGTGLASDVLSLWGLENTFGSDESDTYVLSLTFDPTGIDSAALASGLVGLVSKTDVGTWEWAVDGNFGGTSSFVLGPWNDSYGLGTYGVDPATNTAWAVVNHASDFAVVPEPAALSLVLVALVLRRR